MTTPAAALGREVIAAARALGFHRVGITPVEPPRRHAAFAAWLAADRHGEMSYLEPGGDESRGDLASLLAGARSVIAVALAYDRAQPVTLGPGRGLVARYARGDDYHVVLKRKLRQLAARVAELAGRPVAARTCVDTAPVLERELAERAGLGFVAKNTMLIAPGLGSYVLLGELLVDVDLEVAPAEPERTRCGECRACLDACPTAAFPSPFVLDARRCISYLTIEHRGAIPVDLRPAVGTRVFGCDVCQEVCPWNGGAVREPPAAELAARSPEHVAPELARLVALGSAQRRKFLRGTALRRASREQWLRNVAVALGNAGEASGVPTLERLLADRSALVRGHAAWALGRLGQRARVAAALAAEADPAARQEMAAALAQGDAAAPSAGRLRT